MDQLKDTTHEAHFIVTSTNIDTRNDGVTHAKYCPILVMPQVVDTKSVIKSMKSQWIILTALIAACAI